MDDVKRIEGWDVRNVDFSRIHGDDSRAYEFLLKSLNLREGMCLGDIMCGYGAVSQRVLEFCESKRIILSLFLLDAYQLDRTIPLTRYEDKGHSVNRTLQDARNFSFPKDSLDAIVIKMGLHEVSKEEQVRILANSLHSLKPAGELFIWECMGQTPKINEYFKRIIRKKDELAGYTSMVENRYFCNEEELIDIAEEAGGERVEVIYQDSSFDWNTLNLCQADFGVDVDKLKEYNEYIRSILPINVSQAIKLEDFGDFIIMHFAKKIFRVRK